MPTIYQRQNKSRHWAPSLYKVYERARVCTDMKIYFFHSADFYEWWARIRIIQYVVHVHIRHTLRGDLGDSRKSECPYNRESTKWRALQVVIAMVTIFTVQKFTCREYTPSRTRCWLQTGYSFYFRISVQYFSLWQRAPLLLWTAEGIFSGASYASKIATSMKRVINFCCAALAHGLRWPVSWLLLTRSKVVIPLHCGIFIAGAFSGSKNVMLSGVSRTVCQTEQLYFMHLVNLMWRNVYHRAKESDLNKWCG